MTLQSVHRALADSLLGFLRQGFDLSPEVVHYIDSTFFSPSREQLRTILDDESNSELDSLRELLVFPDETMQLEIESSLEHAPVDESDEMRLIEALCAQPLETTIRFPDSRGSLTLRVPEGVVAQFVRHLNLTRQQPERIAEVVSDFVDGAVQNRVKITLRNAKPVCGDMRLGFLCDFLKASANLQGDLLDHLDLVLRLLDEIDEDANGDVYRSLMSRKRFYVSHLYRARQFDEQRRMSNMETMMSRGIRSPHYDVAELSRTIAKIDTISRAVFGRTEYFDQTQIRECLVNLDGGRDFEKLFQLLS